MNNLCFTANLGSDAEVRYTPTGTAITTFSAALTSGWGEKKVTTWLRCSMWGDRGLKVSPYLTKGVQVAIAGEFSAREWQDKAGVTKTSCEVRVNDLTLVGKRPDSGQTKDAPISKPSTQAAGDFGDFEDDIPF